MRLLARTADQAALDRANATDLVGTLALFVALALLVWVAVGGAEGVVSRPSADVGVALGVILLAAGLWLRWRAARAIGELARRGWR